MADERKADPVQLKCPVCSASFRSVEICPRCGTSLEALMRIAARAWALRELIRTHLRAGQFTQALHMSAEAWHLHQAGMPERLLLQKNASEETTDEAKAESAEQAIFPDTASAG